MNVVRTLLISLTIFALRIPLSAAEAMSAWQALYPGATGQDANLQIRWLVDEENNPMMGRYRIWLDVQNTAAAHAAWVGLWFPELDPETKTWKPINREFYRYSGQKIEPGSSVRSYCYSPDPRMPEHILTISWGEHPDNITYRHSNGQEIVLKDGVPTDVGAPSQGTSGHKSTAAASTMSAPAGNKAPDKAKANSGKIIMTRPDGIPSETWEAGKAAFVDDLGKRPEISGKKDQGDVVQWNYKAKSPEFLATLEIEQHPWFKVIPDSESNDDAAGSTNRVASPTPKQGWVGNGGLPEGAKATDDPGNESLRPKPAPAQPSKFGAKPEYYEHWFDPTDKSADQSNPYIYVLTVKSSPPQRVLLSDAIDLKWIPLDSSRDTMTHYSERDGQVVIDRKTHHVLNGTGKFSKPKK